MVNQRSPGLSITSSIRVTGLCTIPCMVIVSVFPLVSGLTEIIMDLQVKPGRLSRIYPHRLTPSKRGGKVRPRHQKYVEPTPREYRRAFNQYRALRRRERWGGIYFG